MKLSWIIFPVLLLAGCANVSHVPDPVFDYVPPSKIESAQIAIGARHHDNKQYDKAINHYQTLLNNNPNNATVLYEIALIYYAKNDFKKSLNYFKSAARYKSPFLPSIYLLMGKIYNRMGQSYQATLVYKYATKRFNSDVNLHYQLGASYLLLNDPGNAAESFKRCISLDPAHHNSYFQLGAAYYFHDYKTPAFLSLMTFLLIEPNSNRSSLALSLLDDIFKSGAAINKESGEINLSVNINPKIDEGDFQFLDIAMSTRRIELLTDKKKISETNIKKEQVSSYLLALSQFKVDKPKKYFITRKLFPLYKYLYQKNMADTLFFYTHQSLNTSAVIKWKQNNMYKFSELETLLKEFNW